MSDVKERILPEALRSRAASTFTGSYQTLGSPLSNPSRIIKFTNNCSVDVTLSWDGVTDHEYIPAGSFLLLDETSNAVSNSVLVAAAQTQMYVKGSAGTGTMYLSTYYAA